jgi:hypothetical protein
VGASIARWREILAAQRRTEVYEVRMTRSYHGVPLSFHVYTGWDSSENDFRTTAAFRMPLEHPPRVRFHLAVRQLEALRTSSRGAEPKWERTFRPAFGTALSLGDPAFDGRFRVYGDDAGGVQALLAEPSLRQAIAALPAVELLVLETGLELRDPEQVNLRAAQGGLPLPFPEGLLRQLESSVAFHEHVAALLYALRRAG